MDQLQEERNGNTEEVSKVTEEKKGRKRKPKKKKKHRFLKFMLIVIGLVILYQGAKFLCSKVAIKQLQEVAIDYPFTFQNQKDSLWYVTGDFTVPTCYISNEEKERKVQWSASDETIVFDGANGKVSRPESAPKKVFVTQSYQWLLGKAEMTYELTVIPLQSIQVEDVDVVSVEQLANQEYNRELKAVLNENDTLNYMIGDFKNILVYSIEDATAVLNAYRESFGCHQEFSFVINRITETEIHTNYIFDVYFGELKMEECNANLTVNKDTYELVKLEMNVQEDPTNISIPDNDLDCELILHDYIAKNDEEHKDYERLYFYVEEKISKMKVVREYSVFYETGEYYTAKIDVQTGEVIEYYKVVATNFDRVQSTATGETEYGEQVTVNTSRSTMKPGMIYTSEIMHDMERNIHTFENRGWFQYGKKVKSKKDPGIGELVLAVITTGISYALDFEVYVDGGVVQNKVALQSQYYISKAYDWYKNTFHLTSYDGAGAPIVIITDHDSEYDNAGWLGKQQIFCINPTKHFRYSASASPDVMAHEYTHAVFENKMVGSKDDSCEEFDGMNEAYADIFGFLSTNSQTWMFGRNEFLDGTKVCYRDIANLNRDGIDDEIKIYNGNIYPEYYHDENWSGECHAISVVLSHVAYEMWKSELFTSDEVAKIWYNSTGYGYNSASTYLTTREYVTRAAKDMNCTKEQIDFIEKAFSDMGIGEEKSIESSSTAIEGDPMLDDTLKKRYIIMLSPIGTAMGKSGIYIFEESSDMTKEEIKEFEDKLSSIATEYFQKEIGENEFFEVEEVKVEYKQLNSMAMDIAYKFCSDSESYLGNEMFKGLGTSAEDADDYTKDVVKTLMDFSFVWETHECTAYDFYDRLGVLE